MTAINKTDISIWLEHPVSQVMVETFRELLSNHNTDILELIENTPADELKDKLGTLNKLQGQVAILNMIVNVKDTLIWDLEI